MPPKIANPPNHHKTANNRSNQTKRNMKFSTSLTFAVLLIFAAFPAACALGRVGKTHSAFLLLSVPSAVSAIGEINIVQNDFYDLQGEDLMKVLSGKGGMVYPKGKGMHSKGGMNSKGGAMGKKPPVPKAKGGAGRHHHHHHHYHHGGKPAGGNKCCECICYNGVHCECNCWCGMDPDDNGGSHPVVPTKMQITTTTESPKTVGKPAGGNKCCACTCYDGDNDCACNCWCGDGPNFPSNIPTVSPPPMTSPSETTGTTVAITASETTLPGTIETTDGNTRRDRRTMWRLRLEVQLFRVKIARKHLLISSKLALMAAPLT